MRRFVTSEEVHRYAPLMNDILKAQTDNPYAKETLYRPSENIMMVKQG